MVNTGISVVIPLFNKASYIEACVRSALDQDYSPFEIIVVDDGSTDGSGDIVSSMNDPRIRFVRQENRGVSAARNTGVSASSYELIAFLDADDEWLPGHLNSLAGLAEKYPSAVIWATGFQMKNGNEIKVFSIPVSDAPYSMPSYLSALLEGKDLVWTSATMVCKSACLKAGGFLENYNHGEDHALWLSLLLEGDLAISSKVTAIYHRTQASISQRLVVRPDACMVTIDHIEKSGASLDNAVRGMLLELKTKYVLAHAIGAICHGRRDVAGNFLKLSMSTKRFWFRRLVLRILLMLNDYYLNIAARWLFGKNAGEQ